jgi:hypothetical protein
MYRALVVLLAVGACGRRDFDARIDAATSHDATFDGITGHDEDGDGFPDSIDPCPHVAGDLTDTDGDGVGDACDPNPGVASEHWALFATMQAGDTAFDDITGFDQEADAIHVNTSGNTSISLTRSLGRVRIDLGWTVHAVVGGAVQHQVAYGVDNAAATEYYFGELNDNGMGLHDAAIFQYDGTSGYTPLDSQDEGAFHTGDGYNRMDYDTTTQFQTGWTGQLYTLTAATPAYIGGTDVRLALNGVDISIRYLAVIATN